MYVVTGIFALMYIFRLKPWKPFEGTL